MLGDCIPVIYQISNTYKNLTIFKLCFLAGVLKVFAINSTERLMKKSYFIFCILLTRKSYFHKTIF